MTVAEAGRKGGRTVKQRYGADFYGAIGRRGGRATRERHGTQFFEEIGRKGGQRIRELIDIAKQAS
jgi:general stress protein YciG